MRPGHELLNWLWQHPALANLAAGLMLLGVAALGVVLALVAIVVLGL